MTKDEKEFELLKKEWDLAWEHIKGVRSIYWTLFLTIIGFNGFIIKYYSDKFNYELQDGITSIIILTINILILLIYQREHYAQLENYFQINSIRKYILMNSKYSKWNYFYHHRVSPLRNLGYFYYSLFQIIICFTSSLYILVNYCNSCFSNNYCSCVIMMYIAITIISAIVYFCVRSKFIKFKNKLLLEI